MAPPGSESPLESRASSARGCATLVLTLLIASLLFIVNGVVVGMVYAQIAATGPPWLQEAKVAQILMFAGPVVLLVIQWWIFDFISDHVARLSRRR